MYGDVDPEDSYDAGDPVPARLRVLNRVVEDLEQAFHQYRRDDALRLIVNLERERLTRFDRAKLRAIRDRLETL